MFGGDLGCVRPRQIDGMSIPFRELVVEDMSILRRGGETTKIETTILEIPVLLGWNVCTEG